jgi:prepilin-type N-terminal cleavage/methylation domain-containing protein
MQGTQLIQIRKAGRRPSARGARHGGCRTFGADLGQGSPVGETSVLKPRAPALRPGVHAGSTEPRWAAAARNIVTSLGSRSRPDHAAVCFGLGTPPIERQVACSADGDLRAAEPGVNAGPRILRSRRLSRRRGFTLTELLIVIAIIGVLASLAAMAGKAAWDAASRNRITLEIKNISGSIENFKNERGAYPPNGMSIDNETLALVSGDFERMAKKAFPRINQQELLVFAAIAGNTSSNSVAQNGLERGLAGHEALVFWMGGFSDDPQYPLSGPGGPSYDVDSAEGEILESRNWAGGYEFDRTRLGPQVDGQLDDSSVRYVEYSINLAGRTQNRRINFWSYRPANSEFPLVYFDVSRHKPGKYDMVAINRDTFGDDAPIIFPVIQLRTGLKNETGKASDYVFANNGKFQILHCGIDDAWGPEFENMGNQPRLLETGNQVLTFPEGPFIGEIEDTLTNFTDGTLAAAAEE